MVPALVFYWKTIGGSKPTFSDYWKTIGFFFERYPQTEALCVDARKTIGVGYGSFVKCMENDRGMNLLQFLIRSKIAGKR